MRDIILFTAIICYMLGGVFVVRKVEKFLDEDYKGFELEDEEKKDIH